MADVMVADILSRIQSALADSPIYELRTLQVEPGQDAFVLSGTVSSYYHKQLAQELVRAFCNRVGLGLINRIEVKEPSSPSL